MQQQRADDAALHRAVAGCELVEAFEGAEMKVEAGDAAALAPALRPPHDALKTGEGHWARGVTTLIQLPKLMTAAGKSAGESGMLTGAMTVALAKAVAA